VKEGGEESLTSISLAISILAVLVAMVTVLGHRSHTEAVLMQSRAGDQWNLYDAKKIRKTTWLDLDQLQLQPTTDPKATAAKLAEYKAHIAKWTRTLPEQQKAEGFESAGERAEARRRGSILARRCCRSRWCCPRSRCSRGGGVILLVGCCWAWREWWWLRRRGCCTETVS
jgi:hypothetical protein